MSYNYPYPNDQYQDPRDSPKDIDIDKLIFTHKKRFTQRQQTYEKIYYKCCAKIKFTNNTLYSKDCNFTVPFVQYGLPLYHINSCVIYLLLRLNDKGFKVKYEFPNKLFISWEKLVNKHTKDVDLSKVAFQLSKESSVPKLQYIPRIPTTAERLIEGCGGDCCKDKKKRNKLGRRARLEQERQLQQNQIAHLINKKDKYR